MGKKPGDPSTLSTSVTAQIPRLYVAGMSEREVASKLCISLASVHKYLVANGVKMRPRNPLRGGPLNRASSLVVRLYSSEQLSAGQIASRLDVSTESVRKCLIHNGISRRSLSESKEVLWEKPYFIAKWMASQPLSKDEATVWDALQRLGLAYSWNISNSPTMIGRRIPDFVHLERKIVIEVFGHLWHSLEYVPLRRTEAGTKQHYSSHGYECLVLWSRDVRKQARAGTLDNWLLCKEASIG